MMIYLARMLHPTEYGVVVLLQGTIASALVVATFGLSMTATKFVAELKTSDSERLIKILSLCNIFSLALAAAAAIAILVLSKPLATVIYANENATPLVRLVSLIVFFAALEAYYSGILAGFEEFRSLASIALLGTTFGFIFVLWFASIGGALGVVAGLACQSVLQAVLSYLRAKQRLRTIGASFFRLHSLQEWRVIRDFSFPAAVGAACILPAHWICQAMLARTVDGLTQVALLGIAMQWFSLTMLIPTVVGKVSAPMLTARITSSQPRSSVSMLYLAISTNLAVTLLVALTVAAFSEQLIKLYGPQYAMSLNSVQLAVLTGVIVAVQLPVGNVLIASSRLWTGALMNFVWAVIYVTTAYIFLPYGALGVILGMCCAYIVHAFWSSMVAIRITKAT
jgi:O-antigen/teichoic acid export membrane protein